MLDPLLRLSQALPFQLLLPQHPHQLLRRHHHHLRLQLPRRSPQWLLHQLQQTLRWLLTKLLQTLRCLRSILQWHLVQTLRCLRRMLQWHLVQTFQTSPQLPVMFYQWHLPQVPSPPCRPHVFRSMWEHLRRTPKASL